LIRHIIFDFDGTLADTLPLVTDIYNGISKEFNLKEVSPSSLMSLRKKTPRELLHEFNVPLRKMPLIACRVVIQMRQRIAQVLPAVGIEELCRKLSAHDIKLHIVSSNSAENIDAFLVRHQLQCFDKVMTGASAFGKHKLIERLLLLLGARPSSVIYIGDEVRDIAAAKRANIPVIAVGWGFNHPDTLIQHMPDYLISDPAEIFRIVTHYPKAIEMASIMDGNAATRLIQAYPSTS
jgi:phosphoglycolate phosphatase